MSIKDIKKSIFIINCRYNFKIESDGKCYSDKCMMNTASDLRRKIKNKGCKCFNMPEVQEMYNE